MELQKKNEDLCSQMESNMPIAGESNELGELEDMNSSPEQTEQNEIDPENQARMPKNSLFVMEGQFDPNQLKADYYEEIDQN